MKEADYKIPWSAEQSLVARAARFGHPVLASDVTKMTNWLPSPLLPETKSELAAPIKLGGQVLGVLDVQSNVLGGLSKDDELLLVGLCGQIAVVITSYSIHYTKLYEHLLARSYMQARMFPQAVTVLEEAQHISQRNEGLFNRITSYNVCYTKLLRARGWQLLRPSRSKACVHGRH